MTGLEPVTSPLSMDVLPSDIRPIRKTTRDKDRIRGGFTYYMYSYPAFACILLSRMLAGPSPAGPVFIVPLTALRQDRVGHT